MSQDQEYDIDEPLREAPDEEDGFKEVINTADHPVKFKMNGALVKMQPLETRSIPKAYAIPRQLQPNAPALPSVVEHLTNSKILPVDHDKATAALARKASGAKR